MYFRSRHAQQSGIDGPGYTLPTRDIGASLVCEDEQRCGCFRPFQPVAVQARHWPDEGKSKEPEAKEPEAKEPEAKEPEAKEPEAKER
jgi:hypothetical protein